ncbi:amidohydrolase [Bradyrhizobium sp. WBOS7]|uniref:Amidohydrolase n=2 Tax=Nitrobacteraceae TaxID=41294 RepID=A0AAE9SUH4_9BRAD|nr:amidohydrolase [Bradyrhizobium sp. WBOS2]MDD1569117.1 amidohydrolase [Bradyrhizobium sp. WBOS1]MDD1576236.1 amidohydrolase [Bradyrhizobium sp. WBOS7]MDD1602490.1 amidohydrolase [Bradyrhizobium sp. WBOS16]UUO37928.1 amidohydrolase [Bradyrhizobium sp. WBOS01]UUO44093.1 amidohydrolase [Bradyrhizobium sp. WBOS02]UUO54501.1 amidohydrolase [Bradyrhizobium sp. WBOS07]UUO68503.1 amidohydrolase [Bradyrhizobium betae]
MACKLTAAAIVATSMWIAGIANVAAQQPELHAPDLVLINGKVLTLDDQSTTTEAVAVADGKILANGTSAAMKALAGTRTRVLDLAGKTVIPGLIDTHTHFKAAGLGDYVVIMARAKTVAEALAAIKEFAAKKKPGEWIVGGAWHPPSQLAEKRYLTRQEIDSVAPNNPVYLRTVGHFSMANTMAFQRVGVDKTTEDPSGGKFERDAAGELTGLLVETAIDRVEKAVPPWTEDDEMRQFTIAQGFLNSFGITSVIEGATEPRDIRTLQKLVAAGKATLRTGVMFRPEPPADLTGWEAIMSGNGASSGFGDDWLKFAGIKIFYDGGMTLKTALMREVYPDSHDNYHGVAQQTPERLKQLISICNRYDWRVGVHVVGDLGIDQVLDAFEAVDKEKSIRDRRFVLIHASLIRPEQMERAHRLGARVDFQNAFMWDKAATVERFLGKATADRAVPTRTLIEKMGLDSLGAGTDFPVNPINPFLNMYVMVTRKDPNGTVYGSAEAITREQALRLYTSAASRYTFEERRKGTLEPGKLADMVVLSADYTAVPEEQIKDIKADMTLVGGKVVFQR